MGGGKTASRPIPAAVGGKEGGVETLTLTTNQYRGGKGGGAACICRWTDTRRNLLQGGAWRGGKRIVSLSGRKVTIKVWLFFSISPVDQSKKEKEKKKKKPKKKKKKKQNKQQGWCVGLVCMEKAELGAPTSSPYARWCFPVPNCVWFTLLRAKTKLK